jgi:hypothetical protein
MRGRPRALGCEAAFVPFVESQREQRKRQELALSEVEALRLRAQHHATVVEEPAVLLASPRRVLEKDVLEAQRAFDRLLRGW